MATVEENIEAALLARVAAIVLSPTRQVAYPNMAFTPPTDGAVPPKPVAYVKVQQLPNRNERMFLKGSDPHWRRGILQLTVVAPLNGGPKPATKIAGELATWFPADLALYAGGVKVKIAAAPDVAPPLKTDVSWDVPVSISYQASA